MFGRFVKGRLTAQHLTYKYVVPLAIPGDANELVLGQIVKQGGEAVTLGEKVNEFLAETAVVETYKERESITGVYKDFFSWASWEETTYTK